MSDARKELGKIERITVGHGGYQDAMFGVTIVLAGKGWGVTDFKGPWTTEITSGTQWTEQDRRDQYADVMQQLVEWTRDAKVNDVAGLTGKPVEVEFENKTLKSWRLLTEVL